MSVETIVQIMSWEQRIILGWKRVLNYVVDCMSKMILKTEPNYIELFQNKWVKLCELSERNNVEK